MIKPYRPGQTKDHGTKAEKRLAKRIGAQLTPASGALDHAKGDMTIGQFRNEAKSTIHDSIRVRLDDLLKISQEALEQGEQPSLTIMFVGQDGRPRPQGSWVLVPEQVYKSIVE